MAQENWYPYRNQNSISLGAVDTWEKRIFNSIAARHGEAKPGSSNLRQGVILDGGTSDAKDFGSHRLGGQNQPLWIFSP